MLSACIHTYVTPEKQWNNHKSQFDCENLVHCMLLALFPDPASKLEPGNEASSYASELCVEIVLNCPKPTHVQLVVLSPSIH